MIEHFIFSIIVYLLHYPLKLKNTIIYTIAHLSLILSFYFLKLPYIYLTVILVIFDTLYLDQENAGSWLYQLFLIVVMLFIVICIKEILIAEILIMCLYIIAMNNQRTMKKSYEQSMNEYQNTVMSRQVEEVNHLYLTMRGWRHDYHNHMQSLKAYLTKQQYDEAYTYLNSLENDLDDITQIVTTGNVKVDAILNSKFSLALNNNIQLDFKATVPEHLDISDLDLCVLIGNLVDNAVEACYVLEEKDRFIRFYMGTYKQQFYLTLTNATNEVVRKLDEEYITTKRGNHGHGLKRINNVVEKYNGMINRKNEPGVFVTEIMLPLKRV